MRDNMIVFANQCGVSLFDCFCRHYCFGLFEDLVWSMRSESFRDLGATTGGMVLVPGSRWGLPLPGRSVEASSRRSSAVMKLATSLDFWTCVKSGRLADLFIMLGACVSKGKFLRRVNKEAMRSLVFVCVLYQLRLIHKRYQMSQSHIPTIWMSQYRVIQHECYQVIAIGPIKDIEGGNRTIA